MENYQLWYESAAREWVEALPLGNGHMGAMVYGNGLYELTEATCWSGCRVEDPLQADADQYMQKARQAFLERRLDDAEEALRHCTGRKQNYGTQLPMGRLEVKYMAGESVGVPLSCSLNILEGISREIMRVGETEVTAESWISNPAKAMVLKIRAEQAVSVITLSLRGWSNPMKTGIDVDHKQLRVDGMALENIHSDGLHGVSYRICLQMETDGKTMRGRDGFRVEGAREITLYLSAACDLYGMDAVGLAEKRLADAVCAGYDALLSQHIADMDKSMGRCVLTLPGNENSSLPTDRRILAYRQDQTDYALVALYFLYGRYLIGISSREDSVLPAALQGILNDDRACRMEWTDDMHLDINTQMNYYPAEPTGMGESVLPLFRWIRDVLMPEGEKMAQRLYGANGWCAHTISNAHGWAAPGWGVEWGMFLSGGAWAAVHIWEHWLYTEDRDFLKEYFPVILGCARFYHDILSWDEKTGSLLVNPSVSQENAYRHDGKPYYTSIGTTVDTAFARYIFAVADEGARILGMDDAELDAFRYDLEKLPGWQIDDLGRLQEWIEPYEDQFPDHRHMSHLLSLHPLGLIDARNEPKLAAAIRRSVECRLGENALDIVLTNWAGAMLIMLQARLRDGDAAGRFIEPMISFLSRANMLITHEGPTDSETGGIYELDGNTGLTAAITEMLMQNFRDRVEILPGLPASWAWGNVTGLCFYGGHRCDIRWDNREIEVTVTAAKDFAGTLAYREQTRNLDLKAGCQCKVLFSR